MAKSRWRPPSATRGTRINLAFGSSAMPRSIPATIAMVDPSGVTSKMLASLQYRTSVWNGGAAPLVVIGRNALKEQSGHSRQAGALRGAGGRVLIFAQDPDWMTRALGWRVCPKVARRVFPVQSAIADSACANLDSDDLRNWTGSSTLVDEYPEYTGDYFRGNERDQPYAGWHWGNRGGVSSAAIEKPHRSGWRPSAGMRIRSGLYAADGAGLRVRADDHLHVGLGRSRRSRSGGAACGRTADRLRAALPAVAAGQPRCLSGRAGGSGVAR